MSSLVAKTILADGALGFAEKGANLMHFRLPVVCVLLGILAVSGCKTASDAVIDLGNVHQIIRGFGAANILPWRPDMYLTLNSKCNPTYTDPRNRVVDENVRMKQEEDGSILPHFYCDLGDVYGILSEFEIIKLRQIEDIYDGRSSWHYFVLATRGSRKERVRA